MESVPVKINCPRTTRNSALILVHEISLIGGHFVQLDGDSLQTLVYVQISQLPSGICIAGQLQLTNISPAMVLYCIEAAAQCAHAHCSTRAPETV